MIYILDNLVITIP